MPTEQQRCEKEIDLLIEEYRALRAEVVQRLGDRGSLLGFASAGAVLVVANGVATWKFAVAAALLTAALVVFAVRTFRAFGLLSARLGRLEDMINERASAAYGSGPLLRWEYDWRHRKNVRNG